MKKKLIMLLASCSLAIVTFVFAETVKPVEVVNTQMLIQTMGHGTGGG